jgi:hypothetical protein
MANLYIWFETKEERRRFVGEMLGFEPLVFSGARKGTKKYKQIQTTASVFLDSLEGYRKYNPYFEVFKRYSYKQGKELPLEDPEKPPYHLDNIFAKGFRRIYYQKSYLHRPGNWLVIQFRQTGKAIMMEEWIRARIPKERIGQNVPIPESVIIKWKLEYADRELDRVWESEYSEENQEIVMSYILKYLKEILELTFRPLQNKYLNLCNTHKKPVYYALLLC